MEGLPLRGVSDLGRWPSALHLREQASAMGNRIVKHLIVITVGTAATTILTGCSASFCSGAGITVKPAHPVANRKICATLDIPKVDEGTSVSVHWSHDPQIELHKLGEGSQVLIWAAPGKHTLKAQVVCINYDKRKHDLQSHQVTFAVGDVLVPVPPTPPPEPSPTPPTPRRGDRIMLIVSETNNRPQSEVALFAKLRTGKHFDRSKHRLYILDPHSKLANGKADPLIEAVRGKHSLGLSSMLYILDKDTKKLLGATALPASVSGVVSFLKQHGG